jgi:methyl-accepting chemotaxis protein
MASSTEESRRIRFASSLTGRLLLVGVLPAMVLLGALLAWESAGKFEQLERQAEDGLLREALFAASKVGESNSEAVTVARTIASMQESGMFGQRALTVRSLEGILAATPGITAAYVAYEPDADGNDADSIGEGGRALPREWLDDAGRFIPYPFRDWTRGDAIAVKRLVDYETSLYYDGARRAFAERGIPTTIVTEPYVYDGQLIVEQSHPIVIDGRFAGIGATDRSLESIERIVRAGARGAGADAYLVSGRGRVIVATTDPEFGAPAAAGTAELRTRALAETALADALGPLVAGAVPEGMVRDVVTDGDGGGATLLTASVRIPVGDWSIVFVRDRDEVLAPIRAGVMTNAALFGLTLLAAMAIIARTAFATGRRIRGAALAADAIAGGDLCADLPDAGGRDEAGMLLRSLRTMLDNLNGLLAGVKLAGVTLDTSAVELAATSREQQQMASRFGESTAQIAAASRQISATGRELADTMGAVEEATARTAELAGSSREGLATVDATVRELEDATRSIAAKLAAISERAARINGVVETIAKVADQTNLLSVNAAIEAEKAGEQGRGFLVVAREIRRLADQTARATLDIESIVRDMQSAVGAGVMEMDRFAEKVRRAVSEVVHSSAEVGEIIEQVASNAERYRAVAGGMQSQSQGAATISESMVALVDAARRAVESAEEFGRTAAELQRASHTLRESVGRFSLRTGG